MAVDAAHTPRAPRILIIRRDNIGDLACTTPLLEGLRAQLPGAWLGALVTTYNAEVLAGNRALDEVFVYEKLKHRTGGILSHLRSRLGQMSRLMMQVSPHLVRTYGIPREVLREAYDSNAKHQQAKLDALKKVRELCDELGLVTPWSRPLWQGFGIWDAAAAPA